MDRGGRAGQVVDLIDFQVDRVDDVVTDAFKVRISKEMTDIVLASGKEVVEAEDLMSLARSRSQRWEPRNPAPPVMRIRFILLIPPRMP